MKAIESYQLSEDDIKQAISEFVANHIKSDVNVKITLNKKGISATATLNNEDDEDV